MKKIKYAVLISVVLLPLVVVSYKKFLTLNKPLQVSKISEASAKVLALNQMERFEDGWKVKHPKYQAVFTNQGLSFSPKNGPAWFYQMTAANSVKVLDNVSPTFENHIIQYNRGDIVEKYILKESTVEQQFVLLNDALKNKGDFVIEGKVKSEGEYSEKDGRSWKNKHGETTLGDVKVWDAKGQAVVARMEVGYNGIKILIPGSALSQATFPVVVDPEIGTNDFQISSLGQGGAFTTSIAYNPVRNEYLIVWLGDDSRSPLVANEWEAFGQRVNASTGELVGSKIRISQMGVDGDPSTGVAAIPVRVVYGTARNEYLVVWSGSDARILAAGKTEVFGQRLTAEGVEIGTNDFRISDMGPNGDAAYNASSPSVAYNSTDNEYLVVWNGDDNTPPLVDNETEIFGQRLSAEGAEVGTNDFRISDMGPDGNAAYDAFNPSIAYNPTDNQYLIVWSGDDNTGSLVDNENEIYGQRLTSSGAEIGTNDFRISDMGPDGNAAYNAFNPSVAYNSLDGRYLVVWFGDDNTPPLVDNEIEVFAQMLNAQTGVQVGVNDFKISTIGPGDISYGGSGPYVIFNQNNHEFLVTWFGGDTTKQVYGQRVSADGAEIGVDDFLLSDSGLRVVVPNAVSTIYNSTDKQYFTAWEASFPDLRFEILGQRFTNCSDGTQDIGEECDDGNLTSGDGCSSTCLTETFSVAPTGSLLVTTPQCSSPSVNLVAHQTHLAGPGVTLAFNRTESTAVDINFSTLTLPFDVPTDVTLRVGDVPPGSYTVLANATVGTLAQIPIIAAVTVTAGTTPCVSSGTGGSSGSGGDSGTGGSSGSGGDSGTGGSSGTGGGGVGGSGGGAIPPDEGPHSSDSSGGGCSLL